MRRVFLGDALAAARALLGAPSSRRAWVLRRMIAEAQAADRYCQLTRRMHPLWGDGSLMSAALRRRSVPEPFLDDPEYRACVIDVLTELPSRRKGQPRAQDKQVGMAGSRSSRARAISSPHSTQ